MAIDEWSPEPVVGFGSVILILPGLGAAVGIGHGIGSAIFLMTMLIVLAVLIQAVRKNQLATALIALAGLVAGSLLWLFLRPAM